MVDQEETLDKRRANCRIWAHMLFWWLIPFGWIISTVKMRSIVPVFIMLGTMSLSVVTNPYPKQEQSSPEEVFVKSFQHGQKFTLIGCLLGSGFTVSRIIESRKNTQDLD